MGQISVTTFIKITSVLCKICVNGRTGRQTDKPLDLSIHKLFWSTTSRVKKLWNFLHV